MLIPPPDEPDETVRPYAGQPPLKLGIDRYLLEPWQRFDTARYLRIANDGYDEPHSVFPPLYPLLMRWGGWLLRFGGAGDSYTQTRSHLIAGILVSNAAALGAFVALYHIATQQMGGAYAGRALLYFGLFPTGFFLFAAYTESLFIVLALGAMLAAEKERFWLAGMCAFCAALTRTTGVGLILPMAFFLWRSWRRIQKINWAGALAILLPGLAFGLFLGYRAWAGLPPIGQVYADHWHQTTSFPGVDLATALRIMVSGEGIRAGEFTLLFDFVIALALFVVVAFAFRRFEAALGLYCAVMLLFMLLPRSDLKPIYSFSRYALTFYPMFLLLGVAGKNPWINRLILYPFFILSLYFSGQFFIWGWVA